MPADHLVLARAGDVLDAPLGDGTVLLDRRASRSHLLNSSASAVWHAVDGRSTVADLCGRLARQAGGAVPAATVEAEARRVLADLAALALVHPAGEAAGGDRPPLPPPWRPPAPSAEVRSRLDGLLRRGVPIGPFHAALAAVAVDAHDAGVARHLAELTASLPRCDGADHLLEVVPDEARPGCHRIVLDGRDEGGGEGPAGAAGHALAVLNRLAGASAAGHVCLHAGAVGRAGRAVVVAGSSGNGKSTLTAALVRAGHGYLTDELVAVGRDAVAVPYPKALDLTAASCELLGIEPPTGTRKVAVAPARLGDVAGALPVGAVVVLTGAPGAPPAQVSARLDPAAALVALLPHTFGSTFDSPGGLDQLVRLVEQVPVHRLDRFDVGRSAALLAELELR